ncbi:MAG: MBL fold metallo-hydrolase [Clostridia bacterium]|nr:MBL fold metallo-hydrolase [Clostridia bacterium]
MRLCILASGSKGNCTFVEGENTRILIDCGLTKSEVERRLALIGIEPSSIDSILITHEHSDHIAGLNNFASKYECNVFAHPDTWAAMENKMEKIAPTLRHDILSHDFEINELGIESFDLSHDSAHCLGFSVINAGRKISSATDLGFITDDIVRQLADSSVVILEANHDPKRLMLNPRYPIYLKQRILSKHGHLSNKDTAESVLKMLGYGIRGLICAHLSEENNTPDLVISELNKIVAKNGGNLAKEIRVDIAKQDTIGNLYRIKS